MGTNFYYRIPLQKRTSEGLKSIITEYPDFSELKYCLEKIEKRHLIHLGKRSYGWQFLWDFHEGRYYEANLQSIKNFLEQSGGRIEDEYGDVYTIDQFFNDEIKNFLYKDKDHCDAHSYREQHPEEPHYYVIDDHEFVNDMLRFSKDEDFC